MLQWLPLLRLHLGNYCNQAQGMPFRNITSPEKVRFRKKVNHLQIARTLHDEYTPSFSSFFGRGEERSCAFFTAMRADPPAAPEPSGPPAPGAAGTSPAAPMAGDPCWIPALSAMMRSETRRDGRPGESSLRRPLYSTSGGSDMALILIFI